MTNFSVLISVYRNDNAQFFLDALRSIYNFQTLKPSQIVLVKDGPLPNSLNQIIDLFKLECPVLDILSLEHNVGLGLALNEGLKECSFELVARMDSDDISKPNRFKEQLEFICNNPDIDIISCWIDEFQEDIGNVVSIRKLPPNHEDCVKMLKYGCPLSHPAVVFKKSLVLDVGSYQSLYLKEDLYLWLRLFEKNAKFSNIQNSLLFFRISDNVYARRRGWEYMKSEFILFHFRLKIKLINIYEFTLYTFVICIVRLLPKQILRFVYKILRKQ